MKDFVVWLDSKNAHIFAMKTTGVERSTVKKSDMDHHRRHRNDMRSDSHSEPYFQELAKKLKGADQLLIMGPGLAKNHFRDHLENHEAHTLADKIIGLENLESFEHQSEKEMMAVARKFFKTYDLFHNPI